MAGPDRFAVGGSAGQPIIANFLLNERSWVRTRTVRIVVTKVLSPGHFSAQRDRGFFFARTTVTGTDRIALRLGAYAARRRMCRQ